MSIRFKRQIVKTGSSVGISIPNDIVESWNLKPHQPVVIEERENGIFLKFEEAVPDGENQH